MAAVILEPSSKALQGDSFLSFFDDDEDEPTVAGPSGAPRARGRGGPPRPSPRRPQGGGGGGGSLDHHALLVRRRIAAGVGVVLLIVIVLIINGCLKSRKESALKDYNQTPRRSWRSPTRKWAVRCSRRSRALRGAPRSRWSSTSTNTASSLKARRSSAKGFSVPGEMTAAQRNLLLLLDLRTEGIAQGRRTGAHGAGRAEQAGEHLHRGRHGELPGLRRPLLAASGAADRTDTQLPTGSTNRRRRRATSCRTSAGWNRKRCSRA